MGQADFGCAGNEDVCLNGKRPYLVREFTFTDKINTDKTLTVKDLEHLRQIERSKDI